MRTMDFRDANGNGVDDRDETNQKRKGPGPTDTPGTPSSETPTGSPQQMYQGVLGIGNMFQSMFADKPGGDDSTAAMKNSYAYNTLSQFRDTLNSMGLAQFSSGLGKSNMAFQSQLSQQEQSNARFEEFNYGMHAIDKQLGAQEKFANSNFNRDIGYLGASNEQARKNMKAESAEQMKMEINAQEQQRLNVDHSDQIQARKSSRERGAARGLARGF